MRLIDADALENDIRKIIHKRHSKRTVLALYMMLDIVRDRDTIKVRPAKHGKWSLLKKLQYGKQYFLISVRFHAAFVDMVQLLVMNNPRMIGWYI